MTSAAHAEQPVFDEMPRWSGGWGIQVLQELRIRDFRTAKPAGFVDTYQRIHFSHLQGVYTWDKSIRLTLKLPVLAHSELTVEGEGSSGHTRVDRGLGDPVMALPLKKYFNLDGRSGSWTIAPQVRFPLGTTHGYDRLSGAWSAGLSGGYETETYDYIVGGSIGAWASTGSQATEVHVHAGGGPNWRLGRFSGHAKIKADAVVYNTEEMELAVIPIIYMRVTDLIHVQVRTKHTVVAMRPSGGQSRTDSFRLGVGFVY